MLVKDQIVPAIHILLTSKTFHLYEAVFHKIRSLAPNFDPKTVHTDYEAGLKKAFSSVFNGITISGCHFHMAQAVFNKVKKLGLSSTYRKNSDFKFWVHKLMYLPHLPPEDIEGTFDLTARERKNNYAHDDKLSRGYYMKKSKELVLYFKKEWIKKVGTETLSVFDTSHRTN